MTRREAEKLLRETEGNLCARLYRRAHDTIVMENCPVGLRAPGTRVSRWAGAAMALSSLAVAHLPLVQIASAQEQNSEYAVSGVVKDLTGEGIPRAAITTFEESTGKTYIARADSTGFFRIGFRACGSYRVKVEVPGFQNSEKSILLGSERELKLDITMKLGAMMGEVVIVEQPKKQPSAILSTSCRSANIDPGLRVSE
jgi:hypothetical protein